MWTPKYFTLLLELIVVSFVDKDIQVGMAIYRGKIIK